MSLFIFIALVAYLALFLVPSIGEPLAFFGGILLVGLLIHALMLSLVVEALVKRIHRAWLVIPLAAYGGYYAVLCCQNFFIDRKLAELRASNPSQVMAFDPASYSLVTKDADYLVSNYRIPVAYNIDGAQYSGNKGFQSYRLIRRKERCDAPINHVRAVSMPLGSGNVMAQTACLVRMPEGLQSDALTVVSRGAGPDWEFGWGFREGVTEIWLDGKVVGSFRTARIWRWSWFPFAVFACYHKQGASMSLRCHGEVFGHIVYISGISVEVRYDRRALPEAIMLGLPKYTFADTATFEGSDQTFDFLARLGKSN